MWGGGAHSGRRHHGGCGGRPGGAADTHGLHHAARCC
ncbi:hypothetical protein HaLaN_27630, partial [Haematococcus lacustris]